MYKKNLIVDVVGSLSLLFFVVVQFEKWRKLEEVWRLCIAGTKVET